MSPYGIVSLVCLVIAAVAVRPSMLPALLLLGVGLTPARESFAVATIDFQPSRVIAIVMLARVAVTMPLRLDRLVLADWLVAIYLINHVVAASARRGVDGAIFATGCGLDMLAPYLVGRMFLVVSAKSQSLRLLYGSLSIMGIVVASTAVLVSQVGENPAREIVGSIAAIRRENGYRVSVMLDHPILFGTFWSGIAILLCVEMLVRPRVLAGLGAVSGVVCLYASASSTPLLAMLAGLAVFSLYRLRVYLPWAMAASVPFLLAISAMMNRPIVYLVAGAGVLGGSTAYHRAWLMDIALQRFWEWAPVGLDSTRHWDSWGLLWDVTNHFLLDGLQGGVVGLVLGLSLFVLAMQGYWMQSLYSDHMDTRLYCWSWFSMGGLMLTASLGVAFFGSSLFWYSMFVGAGISSGRVALVHQEQSKRRGIGIAMGRSA